MAIRRRNWLLACIVVAAFGVAAALSAVQLMPSLELSSQSAASNRWLWNEPGGLPVRALASAIWPNWLHVFTPGDRNLFKETANFTFLYFYSGQLTVWLALAALFVRKGPARCSPCSRHCAPWCFSADSCRISGDLPSPSQGSADSVYTEFALAGFSLAMAVAAAMVASAPDAVSSALGRRGGVGDRHRTADGRVQSPDEYGRGRMEASRFHPASDA